MSPNKVYNRFSISVISVFPLPSSPPLKLISLLSCAGYTFDLTPEHFTAEQIDPLKYTYDILADRCIDRLDELYPPKSAQKLQEASPSGTSPSSPGTSPTPFKSPRRDLYALLQAHHAEDPTLDSLWKEITTVPSWVDWAQIARGQDVLYRYSGAALTGLTFQALIGGMAAKRVVETLVRTGGLSPSAARRRLLQTLQHILQCTRHPDALRPPGSKKPSGQTVQPNLDIKEEGEGGEGFVASVRVRLLHAAVRRRILHLEREKPGYYSVEEWGVPVNDLDSAATLVSFSASVLWLSLPRQGIWPSEQEKVDYIALWRYIGYLMGYPSRMAVEGYNKTLANQPYTEKSPHAAITINPDCFTKVSMSKIMFESILMHELEPSPTSRLLANNILISLANRPPVHVSISMLAATTRWLNGDELSDALGIPRPSPYWYYTALAAGQCAFFSWMAALDATVVRLSRYHGAAGRWLARATGSGGSTTVGANDTSVDANTAEIEEAVQTGQTGWWFGRTKINRLKTFFWAFAVQSKAGLCGRPTTFDFEWVPRPHHQQNTTPPGYDGDAKVQVDEGDDAFAARDKDGRNEEEKEHTRAWAKRVERRNMKALLILLAVAGLAASATAWWVAKVGGVFGLVSVKLLGARIGL